MICYVDRAPIHVTLITVLLEYHFISCKKGNKYKTNLIRRGGKSGVRVLLYECYVYRTNLEVVQKFGFSTHSRLCLFMCSHSKQQQERPVYIFVFYRRLSWISFLLLSPARSTEHTLSHCLRLSKEDRYYLTGAPRKYQAALLADNLYNISAVVVSCVVLKGLICGSQTLVMFRTKSKAKAR